MGGGGSKAEPLKAMGKKLDMNQFFAQGKWYVMANKPTPFEKGAHNASDAYEWVDEKKGKLKVTFQYNDKSFDGPLKTMYQKGTIYNKETQAEWRVAPIVLGMKMPVSLPYIIIECADDYHYCVVGYPDRSYLWILSPDWRWGQTDEYKTVFQRCVDVHGYSAEDILVVPQKWDDKEEEEKGGKGSTEKQDSEAAAAPAAAEGSEGAVEVEAEAEKAEPEAAKAGAEASS